MHLLAISLYFFFGGGGILIFYDKTTSKNGRILLSHYFDIRPLSFSTTNCRPFPTYTAYFKIDYSSPQHLRPLNSPVADQLTDILPCPSKSFFFLSLSPHLLVKHYLDPTCLQDYHHSLSSTIVDNHFLSPSYKYFLLNIFTIVEPIIVTSSQRRMLTQVMRVEIDALQRNQTWDLLDLPPYKTYIGCKWE